MISEMKEIPMPLRLRFFFSGFTVVLFLREIHLRFNNWDRVRVARLPMLLMYAASCGGGVVLLLVIATGRLAYRGERGSVAA